MLRVPGSHEREVVDFNNNGVVDPTDFPLIKTLLGTSFATGIVVGYFELASPQPGMSIACTATKTAGVVDTHTVRFGD